jgi:hypothetical protein
MSKIQRRPAETFLESRIPDYAKYPPIAAVVFAWGVNEDGQLVSAVNVTLLHSPRPTVSTPKLHPPLILPRTPA